LKLGAVQYLNMLPFFYSEPQVQLFSSPRELNQAMRNGHLDAACMSCVAGREQNYLELPFGVFAENYVLSVLLYSLSGSSAQLLEKLTYYNFQVEAEMHRNIFLFSSGASEQSEWMAKKIFKHLIPSAQIEVVRNKKFEHMPISAIAPKINENSFVFYLCIGDEAIFRRLHKDVNDIFFDVAKLWKALFQQPAHFASWFCRPNVAPRHINDLKQFLSSKVNVWKNMDVQKMTHHIAFFQNQNVRLKNIDTLLLSGFAQQYFKELQFLRKEIN
jgi:predicted solute-binding protein